MGQNEGRTRASSLILQLSATRENFGGPEQPRDDGTAHRLSLDSKLAEVSRQELLSSVVDDNLLIQEVKARLISLEIEDKKKRRGSVKDLVKVFDNVHLDEGPLNSEERNSLRFLLGQFTFDELCEELRKRLEADEISCQPETRDPLDRRFSQGLRRMLLHKNSRSRSKGSFGKEDSLVVIPEIALPLDKEEYADSSENSETFTTENKTLLDTHSLQPPLVKNKPSFEPELRKGDPIFQSSEEVEDEMFMNVLDEIFALKQTMWNTVKDMEEISEKTAKLQKKLATLRQMRTSCIKT